MDFGGNEGFSTVVLTLEIRKTRFWGHETGEGREGGEEGKAPCVIVE
jgi:hypothetical protein